MLQQHLTAQPFGGVLFYQAIDERNRIFGNVLRVFQNCVLDLTLNKLYIEDLFHCLFTADVVKRSLAYQKLVGQNPQTPQINSIVILLSFEYFRRSVVECPTICFTPAIADCSPSEIAQLANSLNYHNSTCESTIFSGLMSRWAILFSCRYFTADAICFILLATSPSGNVLFFFNCENKVPYSMYSRTRYIEVLSSK